MYLLAIKQQVILNIYMSWYVHLHIVVQLFSVFILASISLVLN